MPAFASVFQAMSRRHGAHLVEEISSKSGIDGRNRQPLMMEEEKMSTTDVGRAQKTQERKHDGHWPEFRS